MAQPDRQQGLRACNARSRLMLKMLPPRMIMIDGLKEILGMLMATIITFLMP